MIMDKTENMTKAGKTHYASLVDVLGDEKLFKNHLPLKY